MHFDKNPDWYCTNIYAGLRLKIDLQGNLQVSPCQWFNEVNIVSDDEINNQSIFHHSSLENIRQNHKKTKQLVGPCESCQPSSICTGASTGGGTSGIRSNINLHYLKDQLLYDQTGPTILSIQISSVCNLACTTCGLDLSSKWRSLEKFPKVISSLPEDKIRSVIKNLNLKNLKTVHILGGEPFLDSIHEVVLEELIRHGKNITVWYDSNATQWPSPRTIKLWKMFKLIRLKFSIDGVGDSFEYLRWPAKWKTVEQNMLDMIQQLPSNVMFSLRPAMGFLNFHVVKDIRDWYEKNFFTNREGDLTEFEYNGVSGVFSGDFITQEFKQDLNQIYSSTDPIHQVFPKLIKSTPQNLIDIKSELDRIDMLRGTDYKTSLPYIVKYLDYRN